MKPSGIGGMAVIEGVMMRNKGEYAVAVRKPNKEIAIEKKKYHSFSDKVKLFKLPLFRGMLAFIESLVIGVKVLNFSADFFEEEEETDKKADEVKVVLLDDEKKPGNVLMMISAVVLSLIITIALFMVLPVLISNAFARWIDSRFWLALLEGVIRIVIFIGYILLASRMKEIKRVFMYHGAEHKSINCIENGFELTLENVKWQSKEHKRCGTSFMLFVMVISLIVFILLPPMDILPRVISRILLVPLISGVSYEIIRFAGSKDNKLVDLLSKPGLALQKLTTKEPEDDMIEVAIQSVETVFDWEAFIEAAATEETVREETDLEVSIAETEQEKDKKEVEEDISKEDISKEDISKEDISKEDISKEGISEEDVSEDDEEDDILKALDKYLD